MRSDLLRASAMGYARVVAGLLERPAVDVNQAWDDGVTPLYIASQEGHCEVVSMLLAKEGVDVNQAMDNHPGGRVEAKDGHAFDRPNVAKESIKSAFAPAG